MKTTALQNNLVSHTRQQDIADIALLFATMGDPSRLEILLTLVEREQCVHDLTKAVGMSQSAVSHQLRILRDRKLVRTRRNGRQIFYRLDDAHVTALLSLATDHLSHRSS